MKKIIVTGAAGFIGSAVVRKLFKETDIEILILDKLTYAGNLKTLAGLEKDKRVKFLNVDICDESIRNIFFEFKPDAVMHLAAETHVDRSINGPAEFIRTNILGTFNLLEASLDYWKSVGMPDTFRFHHISTDEVYGTLGAEGFFHETTSYNPSSPYSASKASSDHLVRAWNTTFKLPVVVTNCSNNYGPYQYPEKLIPVVITNALNEKRIPIYGNGLQVRDWLFVDDHADALCAVLMKGKVGETYNVGGDSEKTNLEVVKTICTHLDQLKPRKQGSYVDLIEHVTDRPGHDVRYAIDCNKLKNELNWKQKENFDSGIYKTISWYLENPEWIQEILSSKK